VILYIRVHMGAWRIFLLVLVLFSFIAKADNPANVLVGDVTFTRPKMWKWEQSQNSKAIRFVLPTSAGSLGVTDVRFYLEDKDSSHDDEAWKTRFPDAAKGDSSREKEIEIGKRKVGYLTLRGSYIGAEKKLKRDYMLINATIPFQNQFIRIRILGPKNDVKAASVDFKKMIEDGLAEAE
jgi:hypothetical protein